MKCTAQHFTEPSSLLSSPLLPPPPLFSPLLPSNPGLSYNTISLWNQWNLRSYLGRKDNLFEPGHVGKLKENRNNVGAGENKYVVVSTLVNEEPPHLPPNMMGDECPGCGH